MNESAAKYPPSQNPEFQLDYQAILEILPHRYPFLLVDGVIRYELGKTIQGQKNFTLDERFFGGHFPTDPVVPGVLQIESLAQVSGILIALSFPEMLGKRPAFVGIDEARFKRPVRPGDIMILNAELLNFRRGFASLKTSASVRGNLVSEALLKATMI